MNVMKVAVSSRRCQHKAIMVWCHSVIVLGLSLDGMAILCFSFSIASILLNPSPWIE